MIGALRRAPRLSQTTAVFCLLALSLASIGIAGHQKPARATATLTVGLIKDINPGLSDSKPARLTHAGGLLFFVADDGTHGYELWRSDGTEDGTIMLEDIKPDGSEPFSNLSSHDPDGLTDVGGTLFFTAREARDRPQLWKSDGTEAGTVMVKDINASSRTLTDVGGTLFFSAFGTQGLELWRSDGTDAGTIMVRDINPGPEWSSPGGLTDVGGTLFFTADDGTHGPQLWKSDGTEAGTVMVQDVGPGPHSSFPTHLTDVGGTLFFVAHDGTHGLELWRSDGTEAGTVMVKGFNPATQDSGGDLVARRNTLERLRAEQEDRMALDHDVEDLGPSSLTDVAGTLFFTVDDGTHGRELWRSDGTEDGTVMVRDINPGSANSRPGGLTDVAGTLFFVAHDGTHGQQLWKSDGSEGGTMMVKDMSPGFSSCCWLTDVGGTLFFTAFQRIRGLERLELWRSDGTEAGTVMVEDLNSDGSAKVPINLADVGGTLFFSATDCAHGRELWAVAHDATPPPIEQVTHSRRVGLRRAAVARGLARGRVFTTTDGSTQAHCGAPVRVQIRPLKGGQWRFHKLVTTNRWGTFRASLPNRRLRVRAVAPKVVLRNGNTYERAVSPVRRRR